MPMNNKKNKTYFIGATIRSLIVAFIYVAIFACIINIVFSEKISLAMGIIDTISVDTSNKILKDVKIDLKTMNLKSYPEYGTKYAKISLPTLGLEFDLYFGDTMDVLRNGIGHSSGSYFPGEGGSIICMGHNYAGILKTLPNINIGDEIIITTSYGRFVYKIYDTKIVYYKNVDELPIQRDEEKLMLYTCYPTDGLGHSVDRFVVYANLEESEIY